MHPYVQNLIDQRQQAWHQAKSLLDTAAEEKRELTSDELEQYKRINADLDAKKAQIDEIMSSETREREADEARAAFESAVRPVERAPEARKESAEDKLVEWVKAQFREDRNTTPQAFEFTPSRERRDVPTTATGAPIATDFQSRLTEHLVDTGPMLNPSVITVETTESGRNFQWPRTSSYSSSAITAEAAAISESDPAFSAFITFTAYKHAHLIQVTGEHIEDTSIDLLGFLARQSALAVGLSANADLTTGDGTGNANGVVTASTAGVTGGTGVSGQFTADNLITLYHSVIAPYRARPKAGWMMADAALEDLRQLKEGNGQYLWRPGLEAGEPDRLLGKPIYPNMDVADPATSAKSVLFGDLGSYIVRQVRGVRFERSDEYAFNADLVTLRAILRVDGDLVDTGGAIKHFVGGAS